MLGLSTGCTIGAEARAPEPNIIAATKSGGSFEVDVSSVPDEAVCSKQGGLKDFCVTRFRTAIGGGIDKVLAAYVDRTKPGPAYRSRFKLVQFSHSTTSSGNITAAPLVAGGQPVMMGEGPTIKVTLRWQFELFDGAGKPLVQLAETTDGPQQFNHVSAADNVVEGLLNAVMDRIAATIKASTWPAEAEPPLAAPAVATEAAPDAGTQP